MVDLISVKQHAKTIKILKSIFGVALVAALFAGATYVAQQDVFSISAKIQSGGSASVFLYIVIGAVATVIAPLSSIPLVPIAVSAWGVVPTALWSIVGWWLGSLGAFYLSRNYGILLVQKFVSVHQIEKFERLIPKEDAFWYVVFLRMVIPVDILSYALGLFSHISWKVYAGASLIGIMPFAFILSYAGTVSVSLQLGIIGIVVLVFSIFVYLRGKHKKKPQNGELP